MHVEYFHLLSSLCEKHSFHRTDIRISMSDGGTAMASGETHDASIVNGNDNSNGAPKDLERNAKHDSVDSKWRFSVVIEDFSFVW